MCSEGMLGVLQISKIQQAAGLVKAFSSKWIIVKVYRFILIFITFIFHWLLAFKHIVFHICDKNMDRKIDNGTRQCKHINGHNIKPV